MLVCEMAGYNRVAGSPRINYASTSARPRLAPAGRCQGPFISKRGMPTEVCNNSETPISFSLIERQSQIILAEGGLWVQ